jgi:hypothetical protein
VHSAGGAVGISAVILSEVAGGIGFKVGLPIGFITVRGGGGIEGNIVVLSSKEAQLFAFTIVAPRATDAALRLCAIAASRVRWAGSGLGDARVNVGIEARDDLGGGAFSHAAQHIVG